MRSAQRTLISAAARAPRPRGEIPSCWDRDASSGGGAEKVPTAALRAGVRGVGQTGGMWAVTDAVDLAAAYLSDAGDRWSHVTGVGSTAQALAQRSQLVSDSLVSAAWLHDVGYARRLVHTGCHPIDGARFLKSMDVPEAVIGLVAHHTGAAYEARERGLLDQWKELPTPDPEALDVLTMIDLAIGPSGEPLIDVERVSGILARYDEDDPVHRAVLKSRGGLLASSARAKQRLGLPDDWPLSAPQGVVDAKPHGGMEV
jgi:hypothetical protein